MSSVPARRAHGRHTGQDTCVRDWKVDNFYVEVVPDER